MMNEENTMYLVSFTNFGYTKDFATKEQAQTYMERACLESVLMTVKGEILGGFSPISGLQKNV
jgi:hypothetical protein